MHRRLVPIAIGLVALAAAACSSNASSNSTTTTTTSASKASTTTTSASKATTTTTSGTPQCSTTTLSISLGQGSGAAGHIVTPLVLKNTSSATCVTGGFPGVAGTDSTGAQIIQAARTGPSKGTLTLVPGASASSLVSAVDVPSGNASSCPNLAGLVVTPPNTTTSAQVIGTLPGCPGLSVTALVAGSTGQ